MHDSMAIGTDVPRVTWVNHASFVVTHNGIRLICDPWIEGTAFNDGWAQISPTKFSYGDFRDITHIWFSHQHPDHFAPPNLRNIPLDVRKQITVLYQETPDRLVASFCRTLGFKAVVELRLDEWHDLAPDFKIMCGSVNDDSWLAMKGRAATLLNVNDCVLKREEKISRIATLVGPVDVLFTQFSYAQWIGNPEDGERRRQDAAEKLDRIRLQDRILNPRIIVPFASFIYFCHDENFFMNEGMNDVGTVSEFIEHSLGKKVVVLYPGDDWSVDETPDWKQNAGRYARDAAEKLLKGPTHHMRPSSLSDVENKIETFIARLRRKNPFCRHLVKISTTVLLTDHARAYELSIAGIRPLDPPPERVDVATSSENVTYAMRMPWGGNTLHVSGRFTSSNPGGHLQFFRFFRELHHYNVTPVNWNWIREQWHRMAHGAVNRSRRIAKRLNHGSGIRGSRA